MLTPGDVVQLDLGVPIGSEAGLRRPAVVVTAQRVLRGGPNVIQVVPLTSALRRSSVEVSISPDEQNGLADVSAAQCQHVRSIATSRVQQNLGNVGPVVLGEIREVLGLLIDI